LLRYGRIWLTAQAGGSGLCKFLQILSTINAANLPKLPATLKKRAKKDTSQRVSLQNAIRKKKLMFAAEPAAATPPTKNKPKQSNKQNTKQNKAKNILVYQANKEGRNKIRRTQTRQQNIKNTARQQARPKNQKNQTDQTDKQNIFQNTEILATGRKQR